MRKNKDNNFARKFRLLNSQESTHDISWSMSSSSDEENSHRNVTYCNLTNRHRYHKRKRKRKATNISNLNITLVDTVSPRTNTKSPILCDKSRVQVSPVLKLGLLQSSPILVPRNSQKSPILHQNSVSRKLFKDKDDSLKTNAHGIKCHFIGNKSNTSASNVQNQCVSKINISSTTESSEISSKFDIYRNVKLFFESNFTSDIASQNSISDTTTPKDSVLSDDVDISSGTTDVESAGGHKNTCARDEKVHKDVEKKMKYRKDGHAYRLNALLKKQNANHSLWRHEKFLADNSNFVIPKEEHLIFRIQKAICEYGCTFLNAVDENDKSYCIIINNVYINEKIESDSIIKIYKPYKLLEVDDCRVVLNVFKFDHLPLHLGCG